MYLDSLVVSDSPNDIVLNWPDPLTVLILDVLPTTASGAKCSLKRLSPSIEQLGRQFCLNKRYYINFIVYFFQLRQDCVSNAVAKSDLIFPTKR